MTSDLFSEEERKLIVSAIVQAEKETSGEIQVHIEKHCVPDVLDRAAEVFAILKMNKTKLRNGVLIYLAVKDHKFAIIGDAGINAVVPPNFWEKIKETMREFFKKGEFANGLTTGIQMAGEQLRHHFPYLSGDKNELSDEISFGNN
jgi:uncharacterized membrane protein